MCINERWDNMSAREQIISILDFMGEKETNEILQYVKNSFRLKPKTWDDIEEDEPTLEETQIIEAYIAKRAK